MLPVRRIPVRARAFEFRPFALADGMKVDAMHALRKPRRGDRHADTIGILLESDRSSRRPST